MKKIFITRPLPARVIQKAETLGDVSARTKTTPLSKKEMLLALRNYDIVLPTLGDLFSENIFEQVEKPKCKLLANFGVGYNHINVTAANRRGIMVSNTPGAVTDATADIALTLMLMTARRAGEGERVLRSGKWEGWHPTQMLGLHMSGKTVSIIGMGRIGEAIARRCYFGFGMKVVYASRSEKKMDFPSTQMSSVKEAVVDADFVIAAVPGGAATKHLIGQELFALMPSHSIFVNISRGDVVDEVALIDALQTGQIGGAGLDVYEFEPVVPDELIQLENVTLLPHLGTASLEVRSGMGDMALKNIEDFIEGRSPTNLV